MIVSFHPCFVGDTNIICAGREPDDSDLAATRKARAVILPQGCRPALYKMAAANCRHVFPNYEARFAYPGKLEQIRLFRETRTPHPRTRLFPHTRAWFEKYPTGQGPERPALPLVFKFDWGGEGETVFRIESREALDNTIELAVSYEKTGQHGFLTQELITCQPRALRVVVAGKRLLSYWRVQPHQDRFTTSMSHGAVIDGDDAPELQAMGRESVRAFCKKTKIDLAGFDLLFPTDRPPVPLFLEINYFFGRRGLGGSDRWYAILNAEIERWLQTL
jgi:ribosomal protein S6--L-glutamate ligase